MKILFEHIDIFKATSFSYKKTLLKIVDLLCIVK